MTVISVNVTEVEHFRAAVRQRVGDLHAANQHVRQVQSTLAVNAADPRVHGLSERLSSVAQRIDTTSRQLNDQAQGVGSFLTGLRALDGQAGPPRPSLISLADRLMPFVALGRSPAGIAKGLSVLKPLADGLWSGVPSLPGVAGGLRATRNWSLRVVDRGRRTIEGISARVGDAFNRHVVSRWDRLLSGVREGWRRTSDAFRALWSGAQERRDALVRGLRRVVQTVVSEVLGAGQRIADGAGALQHRIGDGWRDLLAPLLRDVVSTKFPQASRDPAAYSLGTEKLQLSGDVSLPVDVKYFDVAALVEGNVEFEYFSDGTVDIKIGAGMGAGIAAGLDANAPSRQRLEADLERIFGAGQTFRIQTDDMPSGQSAEVIFVLQHVYKMTLLALSAMGGPSHVRVLALLQRARLPATPPPVASHVYTDLVGELNFNTALTSSSVTVRGAAGLERTLRAEVTVDHLTDERRFDVSDTMSAEAAVDLFGIQNLEGMVASGGGALDARLSLLLDPSGAPSQLAITVKGSYGGEAGPGPRQKWDQLRPLVGVESSSRLERVGVVTATVDLSEDDRRRIGALGRLLPASGQALLDLLRRIGARAETTVTVGSEQVTRKGIESEVPTVVGWGLESEERRTVQP